jgi:hypothetical protein
MTDQDDICGLCGQPGTDMNSIGKLRRVQRKSRHVHYGFRSSGIETLCGNKASYHPECEKVTIKEADVTCPRCKELL